MKIFDSKIGSISPKKAAVLTSIVFSIFIFSTPVKAEKITVLIGGALHTCSSYSQQNCQPDHIPAGKKHAIYTINDASLNRLSESAKTILRRNAPGFSTHDANAFNKKIEQFRRHHEKTLTKSALLSLWNEGGSPLSYELNDTMYYALLDSLERQQEKEVVDVTANRSAYASDIVNSVGQQTIRIADNLQLNKKPKILIITASGRDPYESADFYEQLFAFDGTTTQWLPLTPALVDAVMAQDCANLDSYRRKHNTFARSIVYPHRTASESKLCRSGKSGIIDTIRSATTIVFNGGDQSLTRQVMYDENNQAYPWTASLKDRPVVVGTSAGTAVQSGGSNYGKSVPMISNGSALQALKTGAHADSPPSQRCKGDCQNALHPDALTFNTQGGLGRIPLLLDTHFSERDRSVRLHVLAHETSQKAGFGVDETTALVIVDSQSSRKVQVIGENGVVKIVPLDKQAFLYSYYPRGTQIAADNNGIYLKDNTLSERDPTSIAQSTSNLLNNASLRNFTQKMCTARAAKGMATHREGDEVWQFTLNAESATYLQVHEQKNGCAIEGLRIEYQAQP